MAAKLGLWFLPFLLFFLMNGHNIGGRDLNAELQSHSETNSQPYLTGYNTKKEMNSQSYLTGYNTEKEADSQQYLTDTTQSNYKASMKHNHLSHHGKHNHGNLNQPYIISYANSNAHDANKPNYLIGYKTNTHGSDKDFSFSSTNVDHTEAFKVGYFAMDDLFVGNIMSLQFPVEEVPHFLSKKQADSIPFSTSQLSSVLQLFSISQDSPQAKSMRDTLELCEAGMLTDETRICANSLESMLEFVNNILGSEEKHNLYTTSPPLGASLQNYTILKVSEDIYAPKWVACHPLPYPYAVYYCHFIATKTRIFKVLLDGENGDKVEALGVCHLDTSEFNPNHIIFKQLGFMPGEAPLCHFFPVKNLMWVPHPTTTTM